MTADDSIKCRCVHSGLTVFKIPGFACKCFLLSSPTHPHSFTRVIFRKVLGAVYMRKLTPAWVSCRDDFGISYCIYMMTGSFHITLFKGTLHVDKIHVWFKIANITRALPLSVNQQTDFTPKQVVDSYLHDTVARFHTGEKFSPRYNRGDLTPGWLTPAWHFVVLSGKQI